LGLAVLVAVFAAAGSPTLHGGALLLALALLIAVVVRPRRVRHAALVAQPER
jgi:hypothetical protein